MIKKNIHFFLLILLITFLSFSCNHNEEDIDTAYRLKWRIDNLTKKIETKNNNSTIWKKELQASLKTCKDAKNNYNSLVEPVLNRGDTKERKLLLTNIAKVKNVFTLAKNQYQIVREKDKILKSVKADRNSSISYIKFKIGEINNKYNEIKNTADKASKHFKEKKEELDKKVFAVKAAVQSANNHFEKISKSDIINDIQLSNLIYTAKILNKTASKTANKINNDIQSLYYSEVRIISDIKQYPVIEVSRIGWDAGSDANTEHDYSYKPRLVFKRKIDNTAFEYFKKWNPEKEIAYWSRVLFGKNHVEPKIKKKYWDQLNINYKEAWPTNVYDRDKLKAKGINISAGLFSDHDKYEVQAFMEDKKVPWTLRGGDHDDFAFWIKDLYHQDYVLLTIIKNGVKTQKWVEGDPKELGDYKEFLGMEIMNKPLGEFKSNIQSSEAAPPGMAMVGNPNHGKWQTDPKTGNDVWVFIGTYALLNTMLDSGPGGKNHITRSEWNDWNSKYKNKKPYMGSTKDKKQYYGTHGYFIYTNPHYRNTYYMKTSGNYASSRSIRGAGSYNRGRGPGKGK